MARTNIFINQEEIKYYLKDVRKSTILTKEREKVLAKIMMSGDATEEQIKSIHKEMLVGNLRFVLSIAKNYQNQGIDLADLIAEGNFGLLKAIEYFDWSKGFRFISYAVWWVNHSILHCLNETARTIRLPANIIQELYKAKKEAKNGIVQLNKKLSTLPSVTNLSRPINEDGDTLIDVLENESSDAPDAQFNNHDT